MSRFNQFHVIASLLFVSLLLLGAPSSFAAESVDDKVRRISHQLRCPTCQAQSVKESEAGLSLNMKNKVRQLLEEGKSEQEVLDFFVERYGEWILRSPQKKGFNLFLWLTPLVLILLAIGFMVKYLYNRTPKTASSPAPPLTEKEQAAVDKELEQFKMD